jgi:hypothetical protein
MDADSLYHVKELFYKGTYLPNHPKSVARLDAKTPR